MPDRLRVIAPPPLIFCGAILAGLLLEAAFALRAGGGAATSWLGAGLIALGLLGAAAAVRRFFAAGTSPEPRHPATALVTGGIYRYTRNPIYCGMTAICLGIALLTGDPWILLSSAGAVVLTHYGVILREEAYLTRVFGGEYLRYKAAVRRWI